MTYFLPNSKETVKGGKRMSESVREQGRSPPVWGSLCGMPRPRHRLWASAQRRNFGSGGQDSGVTWPGAQLAW